VKEQNKKIGVINFIRMDEYTEFGVYTNPEYRGYGKKLMTTICNHGFEDMNLDRLVAEVFSHNKKALNLYLNFNFTIFKEVLNKRKRIIYLELKNENWKI
jgi:UDP-4-amino-4,6-dideoxy-N-acetyl-beta-L-altrosamine N-acetyltransferase